MKGIKQIVCGLCLLATSSLTLAAPTTSLTTTNQNQTVVHSVWFQLKDGVDGQEVLNRLFALKQLVTLDSRHLVQDVKGGFQNSTEGYAKGLTVGAVFTFQNDADCLYYTFNATDHIAFKAWVAPLVFNTVVMDFADIGNNSTASSNSTSS